MRRLHIEIILISLISLNIYAQRGRVQIKDGTLVTDSGTLLRGAHADTHDESLQSDLWVTHENIRKMKDYGLNSIRLYTESPWRGDTAGYRSAFVDSVVKWTRQENMYAILVWAGWTTNETTHEESIAHNFHKNFWRFYAPRYKDETHVIYEICSEPGPSNNLPAPDYRSFDPSAIEMELESYNLIRSLAPKTHILLMSPYEFTYNQFINDIKRLGSGIDWSNASIAGHAYTYPAQDYIEPIRKLKNAGYAITVTEFHSFMNEYANLALTRVFENKFVSYFHFLSAKQIIDNPAVFKSRVESSEVRWTPDFGTWPESITEINYQSPYKYWPAIFYDEGSGWVNYFEDEIITYISNNDYVAYYSIDFQEGPSSFEALCSATASDGRIELRLDSVNGQLVGVCQLSNTGSLDNYETFTCNDITPFTGVHDLYLKFIRNDNSPMFNLRSWYFINSEQSVSQTPYHGSAIIIPGKIEAEEYDYGGQTISFLDMDTINQGGFFRKDGVDIDTTKDGGYCIGWTGPCEWIEYTVSCQQESAMDIQLRVACTKQGYKFNIKLDNRLLAKVSLPNTGGYYTWETVTIEGIQIPAGENQIIRIEILDGYTNLDWMNFIETEPSGFDEVKNNRKFTFYPNPAHDFIKVKTGEPVLIEIYSLQGQLLIRKKISTDDDLIPVGNLTSGSYFIKILNRTSLFSDILIIE